jgi:predicted component of type VI protein secretion system
VIQELQENGKAMARQIGDLQKVVAMSRQIADLKKEVDANIAKI